MLTCSWSSYSKEIEIDSDLWENDPKIHGKSRIFLPIFITEYLFLKLTLAVSATRQLTKGPVRPCQLLSFQSDLATE